MAGRVVISPKRQMTVGDMKCCSTQGVIIVADDSREQSTEMFKSIDENGGGGTEHELQITFKV